MVSLPAGIRVDVSVSSPEGQPREELRADSLLVSLEKWTESWTRGLMIDSVQVPALSGWVTLGRD